MEMKFSNPYCPMHPHELIINYCVSKQCQTGLCANCLGIHTQMHLKRGIAPEYQNIRETYQKIMNEIDESIKQIQSVKTRIDNVEKKVQQKKQKVRQVLQMAKQDIILLVQKHFKCHQQQITHLIEYKDRQKGLHCVNRLKQLKSQLYRQDENLRLAREAINSRKFIESISKVKAQLLYNTNLTKMSISQQILNNQNYLLSINYDKKKLNNFQEMLRILVEVRIEDQLINDSCCLFSKDMLQIPRISQLKMNLFNKSQNQQDICKIDFDNKQSKANLVQKHKLRNLNFQGSSKIFQINNKDLMYFPISQPKISEKFPYIQYLQLQAQQQQSNGESQNFKLGLGTEQSRVTTQTKKNIGLYKQKQEEQDSMNSSSTSGFNYFTKVQNGSQDIVQKKDNVFEVEKDFSKNQSKQKYNKQKDENNFTFGSQVYKYNPFQAMNRKNQIKNELNNISRYSSNKNYSQYLNAAPISAQDRKIKQNIVKMQKQSNKFGINFNNSQYQSFYPQQSNHENKKSKKFIFRTQYS